MGIKLERLRIQIFEILFWMLKNLMLITNSNAKKKGFDIEISIGQTLDT